MSLVLVVPKTFNETLEYLDTFDELGIDLETSGLDYINDYIVGVSIATEKESFYFPVKHEKGNIEAYKLLLWLKLHENKQWDFHNAKFDWQFLKEWGVDLNIANDSMIMAHLLDVNRGRKQRLKLKYLMKSVLKLKETPSYKELFGENDLGEFPPEAVCNYACRDALATRILCEKWKVDIQQFIDLYMVEIELIKVVARMEMNGINIDLERLNKIIDEYTDKIPILVKHIYNVLGCEVELNSTEKLAKVLIEKIKIPLTERTANTKKYKLTKEVLEGFQYQFPVAKLILEYRNMSKMSNTFLKNLKNFINPTSGRLHAGFHQVQPTSGRFSSSKPNLQNIPVNDSINVRSLISAPEGYTLAAIDYSQIEVRIMLALSNSVIAERLKSGEKIDIHTWMASIVYNKTEDKVTKKERTFAKTVTFGIAYGMTEYGLSRRLDITTEQALAVIHLYFSRIDGVSDFIERTHHFVAKYGYTSSAWGRKRRFPEIYSTNAGIRGYGFRSSVNHRIQGTAADMLKVAMIKVQRFLDSKYKNRIKIILTVHDELVFEIPNYLDIKKTVLELVDVMEISFRGVPMTVDAEIGSDWGGMKDVK